VSSRDLSWLIWALLGGAVALWLLVTARSNGRLPTLGAVVNRVQANRAGRVLLALGWFWLGWHAFAR
jgi:hypothetical protein